MADNLKIIKTMLVVLAVIAAFQLSLHLYYEATDTPMQLYLKEHADEQFGIVYTKDLPCGALDGICYLKNQMAFTFTTPSSVNYDTSFNVFINNVGEPWKGTYSNTIKNPNTNKEGSCDKIAATFTLAYANGNDVPSSMGVKALSYSSGSGVCYASQYYKVSSASSLEYGSTFKAKVSMQTDTSLGTPVYTKLYSNSITISNACTSSTLTNCNTASSCSAVGGTWCGGGCVSADLCTCSVAWLNSANCEADGKIWQNQRQIDCSVKYVVKENCKYGCYSDTDTCKPKPEETTCSVSWLNEPFCSGDDVWQLQRQTDCSEKNVKKETCSYGCIGGVCSTEPIETTCSVSWLNEPFCSGDDVWQLQKQTDCSEKNVLKMKCSYSCIGGVCSIEPLSPEENGSNVIPENVIPEELPPKELPPMSIIIFVLLTIGGVIGIYYFGKQKGWF